MKLLKKNCKKMGDRGTGPVHLYSNYILSYIDNSMHSFAEYKHILYL